MIEFHSQDQLAFDLNNTSAGEEEEDIQRTKMQWSELAHVIKIIEFRYHPSG